MNEEQKKKRMILFVCTFNLNRSVCAEYFLRRELARRGKELLKEIEVTSAGIVTEEVERLLKEKGIPSPKFGESPPRQIIEIGFKKGIDLSNHKSRLLDNSLVEKSDLIITMDGAQKNAILSLYPQAKGKVFTFREFLSFSNFPSIIEDSLTLPQYDPEVGYKYPYEYDEQVMSSIEQCIKEGVEKFTSFLGAIPKC